MNSENDHNIDHVYPDDHEDEYIPPRRSLLLRIVALLTVLAFVGLIAVTYWSGLGTPIVELVSKSLQKRNDIDPRLIQAVVKIQVVSRKKGSSIAVEEKSGTGFNISSDGVIITNHHVIDEALNITVRFPDGGVYSAARWSSKPEYDLALITLDKANLPAVPLNESEPPALGDHVRIVGNPLGLNNIIVEGKVRQYLTSREQPREVFSIDAPIYPGNSGSPVYDSHGKVVGVIFGRLQQQELIYGLAVPIKDIFTP